jgi:hypothetical protein
MNGMLSQGPRKAPRYRTTGRKEKLQGAREQGYDALSNTPQNVALVDVVQRNHFAKTRELLTATNCPGQECTVASKLREVELSTKPCGVEKDVLTEEHKT